MHEQSKDRRSGDGGFVLIWVLASMAALMGFAALAVDGSRMMQMRGQLQATADGAALAAVGELPNLVTARLRALEYAGKNMPAGHHGEVLKPADVVLGTWNRATRTFAAGGVPADAIEVRVQRSDANDNPMRTTLAKALGFQDADVSAKAVAAFGTAQTWDIVLVQDVTGSFSEEIGDARTADQALLDCFASHVGPESRFGLVTFTGYGQVVATLQKIISSYLSLSSAVGSIKNCGKTGMPPCSGTNVAAGLEAGVNLLAANPPDDPETRRAIVLVGDGKPTHSNNGPNLSAAQLTSLARTWADNAAAADISVFVVFFDQNNDTTASTFMESLVRGDGIYLKTPNPSSLPDLLLTICAQLPTQLVD